MDRHESVTASQTSSPASVDQFVNSNPGRTVRKIVSGAGLLSIGLGAGACVTQVEPTKTVPPETGAVDPAAVTKPPEEVHETQTAVAEETDTAPTTTPKPSKTPEPTATKEPTEVPIPTVDSGKETKWTTLGFLPDYRLNNQVFETSATVPNGEVLKGDGWRIGMTEVFVAKEAQAQLDGKMIKPNLEYSIDPLGDVGKIVHAVNLGILPRDFAQDADLGDWQSAYEKAIAADPQAKYELKGELPVEGQPGTYKIAVLGEVDSNLPVKIVILPAVPKTMDPQTLGIKCPFGLLYADRSQGCYGVKIDNKGALTIYASSFAVKTDGNYVGMEDPSGFLVDAAKIGSTERFRSVGLSLSALDMMLYRRYDPFFALFFNESPISPSGSRVSWKENA